VLPGPHRNGSASEGLELVTSGYQAYQSNSVFTATPEQLVIMLYDGALRFSRRALGAWANGDKPGATTAVGRVTAIVHELNATLDMDKGGEIAENLRSIYTFLSGYLVESVTQQDPVKLRRAMELLMELREAFSQAAKKTAAAA
jgi:flagellar secretion chaperone FliS